MSDEPYTILIVDDEPMLRDMMTEFFKINHPNWTILTSPSVENALETLAGHQIDLVVTDLVLPGADGIELVRGIRAIRPQLPVVLMSGSITGASQKRAYDAGASHVIPKPFPMPTLVKLVGELLAAKDAD